MVFALENETSIKATSSQKMKLMDIHTVISQITTFDKTIFVKHDAKEVLKYRSKNFELSTDRLKRKLDFFMFF
jgi:hypothetical protein